MTNHFRIQQASGKDLWRLYGFLRNTCEQVPCFQSWGDAERAVPPHSELGESGLLRMLKEQLESPWHLFLMAEAGEEVLGAVRTTLPHLGPNPPSHVLALLKVVPEGRALGVGGELVAAVERIGNEFGFRELFLECDESELSDLPTFDRIGKLSWDAAPARPCVVWVLARKLLACADEPRRSRDEGDRPIPLPRCPQVTTEQRPVITSAN